MNNKNKIIVKPWGSYTLLEKKQGYWIKKLFVRKGARISLQSHKKRCEIWIVLSGNIEAVKGTAHLLLAEGAFLKIEKGEKHRITGLKDSWVLEVAFGTMQEHDITRFDDDYGRIK